MSLTFQPKIEIKAKHLYVLAALLVLATGSIYFSTAYGTNNPEEFGHSSGEVEIEGTVPPGAIMIFDQDCPSGWSRFSALDGKYPRGANSYGSTGGSTSHSHSFDITKKPPGYDDYGDWAEFLLGNIDSNSHLDPYLEVVYCQKD